MSQVRILSSRLRLAAQSFLYARWFVLSLYYELTRVDCSVIERLAIASSEMAGPAIASIRVAFGAVALLTI